MTGALNHKYTCGDVFYQLVRLAILGNIIYWSHYGGNLLAAQQKIDSPRWVGFASFVAAVLVYILLNVFFNGLMFLFVGCEALSFHDYSFLLDV